MSYSPEENRPESSLRQQQNPCPPPPQYQPPQYYPQQAQYQPPQYYPQQGQYQPPQYYSPQTQYQPPQYYPQQAQYQPPQYYPQQGQYQPPQYYSQQGQYQPPQAQYQPPQYYPQQGQYQPAQYYPQQTPVYYAPVTFLSPEQVNAQLFRKHCSRVGLMLMADMGIMAAVEIVVIIFGAVAFWLLKNQYFSGVDWTSAFANITMFGAALAPIISHFVPAASHGHKWGIKPLDPFRGDRLSTGFILTATVTALGLNSLWGYLYYFCQNWLETVTGAVVTEPDIYTPETMPPVGFILMMLWACVVAPITEEYMFRGMILRTLSKHGTAFGIVVSALLFGLMHGNLAQTPMAFLIGLVLGYVAMKSGNIRQTIFIHMVNNIIATVPLAIYYFVPQYYDWYDRAATVIQLAEIAFAMVALIVFAVKRHKGLQARRSRLQSGSASVSREEYNWSRLEIPALRRTPQFRLVRHKFGHCLISPGMLVFEMTTLLSVFVISIVPYLAALLSNS